MNLILDWLAWAAGRWRIQEFVLGGGAFSFFMRDTPKMVLKGRVHIFFIRELDVPPLGESNLMSPKKSVEVKFFTVAFFGGCRASSNGARRHY